MPASAVLAQEQAEKELQAAQRTRQLSDDDKKPMAQDYPQALDNRPDSRSAEEIEKAKLPTATNEPMPSAEDMRRQEAPGELEHKRTATSEVIRNQDGTITEKQYLQAIHYQKDGRWEKIDTSRQSLRRADQ